MISKTRGIIAAGDRKTAAAAQEIFTLGGNAFDAIAAAILASFVVEPTLTSPAGGGFLLAHTPENRNLLFDFFTQTPRYKRPNQEINFYPVHLCFGDAIQPFHIGLGSMAVPGNLAGVYRVHQQLGKLPFSVVAEPAITYAKEGVPLSSFQDYCINELLYPILLALPESRKTYNPQGKKVRQGEKLAFPDFAETLTAIVQEGIELFYQGEIAQKVVKDCQENGGHLTLEDFQNYQVICRRPLETQYRGRTLLSNPPPSSGGILIAFALQLLNSVELREIAVGSAEHRQILAQVMQLTNQARQQGYNGQIYQDTIAQDFLSSQATTPYTEALQTQVNKWGSTTHVSVIDEWGNAASATTSNGEGSGYMIPGTGIMMNNMLGEEDLNPNGFHEWPCDRRISSMMAPTLVLNQGKPEIVLGSGGSNRIRTAILQVIINLLDFQLPLEDAVNFPRCHWENQVFHLEPPYNEAIVSNLQLPEGTETLCWQQKNMFFGGVHGVSHTSDGTMMGAGDFRRGGFTCQT
ncbi:gamma-glutamyltransferase [Spirulina sp. CS-785/01]|uniref:gamma-glutamyltransferase n=1 Tax=Spirulina sp. CS-785/01 TaxID=3021716 RepID=UPI00232B6659|nr:gamma-glutamyltransferase [Spirulina sp. CS-785/01]MDB9315954.1 gamma-glutamyltransferase [Spirulina sp. CS-785/01]